MIWVSQRDGDFSLISSDPASPWDDGGVQTARASSPSIGDTAQVNHVLTSTDAIDIDAITGTGTLTFSAGVYANIISIPVACAGGTSEIPLMLGGTVSVKDVTPAVINQTGCYLDLSQAIIMIAGTYSVAVQNYGIIVSDIVASASGAYAYGVSNNGTILGCVYGTAVGDFAVAVSSISSMYGLAAITGSVFGTAVGSNATGVQNTGTVILGDVTGNATGADSIGVTSNPYDDGLGTLYGSITGTVTGSGAAWGIYNDSTINGTVIGRGGTGIITGMNSVVYLNDGTTPAQTIVGTLNTTPFCVIGDSTSVYVYPGIYDGMSYYSAGIYDGSFVWDTGLFDGTTHAATGAYDGTLHEYVYGSSNGLIMDADGIITSGLGVLSGTPAVRTALEDVAFPAPENVTPDELTWGFAGELGPGTLDITADNPPADQVLESAGGTYKVPDHFLRLK